MLVNGAVNTGQSIEAQGLGRVGLANSVILQGITTNKGYCEGELLDEGRDVGFDKVLKLGGLLMPDGPDTAEVTLKATMVYTDLPKAALQNNLNLHVTVVDQPGRFENTGNEPDMTNSVERVVWESITPNRDLEIRFNVSAPQTMMGDKQSFALVWGIS